MEGNTTNSTERSCGLSEMPARPFFISVYTLICLASLVLNTITIYVYFCKVTTKSSIILFLKNLAVADMFVCLCLILRIIKYAVSSEEVQRIYCNFGAPAAYLNMYCSILFMGYIAVNRYSTQVCFYTVEFFKGNPVVFFTNFDKESQVNLFLFKPCGQEYFYDVTSSIYFP